MNEEESENTKEKSYIDKGAFAGFFLFIVIARLIRPDLGILLTALIGGVGAGFGCLIACLGKSTK